MARRNKTTPSENTRPSTCSISPWISAQGTGQGCYEDGQSFVGKWLLFVSRENIDSVWERIECATRKGELGVSAKVSTVFSDGYDSSSHVVCVYTRDFRDKDDVSRVLKSLRENGITGRLFYKTDEATLSGLYAKNGPFTTKKGRASLYGSDDFEG